MYEIGISRKEESVPGNGNHRSLNKVRILMIEDNRLLAHAYLRQMETSRFCVDWANDGTVGMRKYMETKPDAVLLDLLLPGASGMEILKRIRAHEVSRGIEIPIFVFTSGYSKAAEHEARLAGATHCYDKSRTDAMEVLVKLESEFRKRGMHTNGGFGGESNSGKSAIRHTSLTEINPRRDAEEALQIELLEMFLSDVSRVTDELNQYRELFCKAENSLDEGGIRDSLEKLHRVCHNLIANAGFSGLTDLSDLSRRLDRIIFELLEQPDGVNTSCQSAVDQGIDELISKLKEAASNSGLRGQSDFVIQIVRCSI